MGRTNRKSTLRQNIAEILGTAAPADKTQAPGPLRKSLIYSSMVLLAANPGQAYAVGLGEMNVQSKLGQPLTATVPLTLGKGESISQGCIKPGNAGNGLNNPNGIKISAPIGAGAGNYNLRVTTANVLHEPMYEISLLIDCPGTPIFMRQYVLMLDLPAAPVEPISAGNPEVTSGDVVALPNTSITPAPAPVVSRAQQADQSRSLRRKGTPIAAGSEYRVSEGDTLSTIANRIEGRQPDATWRVASHLFDNNPNAFIRNNPDLIKLGSVIRIPDLATLETLTKSKSSAIASAEKTSGGAPQPEPARTTTPAATNARPEQIAVTETPDTAVNTADSITNTTESAPAPMEVAGDSPFADEAAPAESALTESAPAEAAEPATAEAATEVAAPATAVTATETASITVNASQSEEGGSLWTILLSILAAAIAGFIALRTNFLTNLRQLIGGRKKSATNLHIPAEPLTAKPSAAEPAASETKPVAAEANAVTEDDFQALPLGNPAEDTYIVESMTSDPRVFSHIAGDDAEATAEQTSAPDLTGESADEAMMTQLYTEHRAVQASEDEDIFDPTGGADLDSGNGISAAGEIDFPIEEDFSGAAASEDTFDEMFATSELTAAQEAEIDQSLIEELGNTMKERLDDSSLSAGLSEAAETDEPGPEDTGSDLNSLSSEDDDLSEELEEALTMLEKEFEDEFTASQILERSELKAALEDDADEEELDTNPLKQQSNA